MDLALDGKVAIVTAGGGAICGAVARALAHEGVSVAIWDKSEEAAVKVALDITRAGGEATAISCDSTNVEDISRATETTIGRFGRIDILVSGAGGNRPETTTSTAQPFFAVDPGEMKKTLELNYLSTVMTAQRVGREFSRQGSGVVITISSIAGVLPLTRALTYSDGKAALISFTRWLAVDMARNHSPAIRVNTVAPGFVLTDQNRFLLVDAKTGGATERGKTILGSVPAGRYGTPEDIAGAVVFLASDRAGFITGSVLTVDGGFTASSGV